MAEHRSLFRAVVAALGAAALLACSIAGAGTANAATVGTNDLDGRITVNQAEVDHKFKAVRIGAYSSAENDGNAIFALEVNKLTTPATLVDAVDSAAADAGATAPVGTSSECPNDVVCWISRHWLGYDNGRQDNQDKTSGSASTGYTGKLRNFVTKLQNKQAFKDAITTATPVSVSNGKAEFTGLAEGLYVIEDVTTQNNSIPMLIGTTVGPNRLNSFANTGLQKIGQINMKQSGTPTVKKKWVGTTDANGESVKRGDTPLDGDTMHFKLSSKVPSTTGFTNYFFKITDKPTVGLKYMDNSAKVKVGRDSKDVIAAPASVPVSTPDKVYIDKSNDGSIGFTFPKVMAYERNAPITISYDMKVVQPGSQRNMSGIDWSDNSGNQPISSCIANPATGCGSTQHADMNGVSFASYYLKFRSVDSSKDNAPVGGAVFEVYRKGDKTPLLFRMLADGSYVYHPARDAGSHSTSRLISGVGKQTDNGGRGLGVLKLDGLPPGIYTIKEIASPSGSSDAQLAEFDVKITKDPSNGGAYVSIVRDDANGLVNGKPVATDDHLGGDITLNVTKAPETIPEHINHIINSVIAPIIGHGNGDAAGNRNSTNDRTSNGTSDGSGSNGTGNGTSNGTSDGSGSNGTGNGTSNGTSNGSGSNNSGPLSVLATTGISVVALLVLLCVLVAVGTALVGRRHRIQR